MTQINDSLYSLGARLQQEHIFLNYSLLN